MNFSTPPAEDVFFFNFYKRQKVSGVRPLKMGALLNGELTPPHDAEWEKNITKRRHAFFFSFRYSRPAVNVDA